MGVQVQHRKAAPQARAKPPRHLHSHAAYVALKQRIVTNQLPGGSRFLEEQLAADLGISRTPLREALLNLQAEGLVRLTPRRGVLIVPLTADDIIEIYSVLEALEDLAIKLIGERADNSADIAGLAADVQAMQEALVDDNLEAWAIADERFHGCLVAASGNGRLSRVAETFLTQSQRFRLFTLRLRPKPVKSTRNHAALVKALKDGDVQKARDIHAAQKVGWREDMIALLAKFKITQV
ncbi:MAG: GntR family transcriptional regulator [Pseudolabrys sp.]|nr:GntR family transcriptional regulator [Pseudolabrys sp.]